MEVRHRQERPVVQVAHAGAQLVQHPAPHGIVHVRHVVSDERPMHAGADVAQRALEEVPHHARFQLAMDRAGAEHVGAPAKADCRKRLLARESAAPVHAPASVERA